MRNWQDSLDIFRGIGGRQNLALLSHNMGQLHQYKGNHKAAVALYRQVLATYRAIGDLQHQAHALADIGSVYQAADQFDEALAHYEKAASLGTAAGDHYVSVRALCGIADVHFGAGRLGVALENYERAARLSGEIESLYLKARALHGMAETMFRTRVRERQGSTGGRLTTSSPSSERRRAPLSKYAWTFWIRRLPEEVAVASNELSGTVHGSAVQARSIRGGVHFSVTQAGSAQFPVPAQLPPAAPYFTGRAGELAALESIVAERDPARRLAVAVVSGTGGVGKTSLVSYWLHSISDQYEGGVLYADLRGHIPAAATPPGTILPASWPRWARRRSGYQLELGEQAKLYRSLTSGRRTLVLLDNAATAAQVRVLLPGPGPRPAEHRTEAAEQVRTPAELASLVVVTTRWRIIGLAMDGARFLELGPMDDVSGTELLGHMVGPAEPRRRQKPSAPSCACAAGCRWPCA